MKKVFNTYEEAYQLYSDIVSGREPDRKNASISYMYRETGDCWVVCWQGK